ncbi:hypothetical protein STCU_11852 [Strigomonas culicis]|uniref:Uncharacterized protein n=1 Tax=Strigomonas culicis TaxID=28005 RepID=S9TCC9_9TRYP|nr:hypothetical protein STCU_11852 [Strigomonas culicis]|eukprot:EPY15657.1 hypothetical protein STCU_11852 [Strigomonas culicis]
MRERVTTPLKDASPTARDRVAMALKDDSQTTRERVMVPLKEASPTARDRVAMALKNDSQTTRERVMAPLKEASPTARDPVAMALKDDSRDRVLSPLKGRLQTTRGPVMSLAARQYSASAAASKRRISTAKLFAARAVVEVAPPPADADGDGAPEDGTALRNQSVVTQPTADRGKYTRQPPRKRSSTTGPVVRGALPKVEKLQVLPAVSREERRADEPAAAETEQADGRGSEACDACAPDNAAVSPSWLHQSAASETRTGAVLPAVPTEAPVELPTPPLRQLRRATDPGDSHTSPPRKECAATDDAAMQPLRRSLTPLQHISSAVSEPLAVRTATDSPEPQPLSDTTHGQRALVDRANSVAASTESVPLPFDRKRPLQPQSLPPPRPAPVETDENRAESACTSDRQNDCPTNANMGPLRSAPRRRPLNRGFVEAPPAEIIVYSRSTKRKLRRATLERKERDNSLL